MVELLALAAAACVLGFVGGFLRKMWGKCPATEELTNAPMSGTDLEMAERTKAVIHEVFGEDVKASVREMGSVERLQKAEEFANRLASEYGLSTTAGFYGKEMNSCGSYSYSEDKIYLNVAALFEEREELLEESLDIFMSTVIHELRHAVQYKAIMEEGFWKVDDGRRLRWAENLANYNRPEVNIKTYAMQPVELDARTFAAIAMEGVIK